MPLTTHKLLKLNFMDVYLRVLPCYLLKYIIYIFILLVIY